MKRRLLYARLVRGCWAALFLLQVAWWGWLADEPPVPRVLLVLLTAGPLLLPIRGIVNDRLRSYFWFNLLVLPYFAAAVASAWAHPGERPLAWMQMALTVTAFTAGFLRTRRG